MSIGIIEIGSRAVRYMVARFAANGSLQIEFAPKPFPHEIFIDQIEEDKVATLFSVVDAFKRDVEMRGCSRVRIYGTALLRRLIDLPGYTLPSYVEVLSAEQEAICAWAAGFMSGHSKRAGSRFTIVDQGGGSAEIISGSWTGKELGDDFSFYALENASSQHLTQLYITWKDKYLSKLKPIIEDQSNSLKRHEAKDEKSELILLGSVATKLAFNIKHKRNENDDYRQKLVDGSLLKVKDISDYFNKMSKLYRLDPESARRALDRREIYSTEYEMIMSNAVFLMILALRLGYQEFSISANGTRHGMAFLMKNGFI